MNRKILEIFLKRLMSEEGFYRLWFSFNFPLSLCFYKNIYVKCQNLRKCFQMFLIKFIAGYKLTFSSFYEISGKRDFSSIVCKVLIELLTKFFEMMWIMYIYTILKLTQDCIHYISLWKKKYGKYYFIYDIIKNYNLHFENAWFY